MVYVMTKRSYENEAKNKCSSLLYYICATKFHNNILFFFIKNVEKINLPSLAITKTPVPYVVILAPKIFLNVEFYFCFRGQRPLKQ